MWSLQPLFISEWRQCLLPTRHSHRQCHPQFSLELGAPLVAHPTFVRALSVCVPVSQAVKKLNRFSLFFNLLFSADESPRWCNRKLRRPELTLPNKASFLRKELLSKHRRWRNQEIPIIGSSRKRLPCFAWKVFRTILKEKKLSYRGCKIAYSIKLYHWSVFARRRLQHPTSPK